METSLPRCLRTGSDSFSGAMKSCVLPEAAIKVLPVRLARGESADHYRKGWEEKEAKGAPVVEGIIDLPDRLPGPGTDNLVAPGGFEPSFKLPEVTQ